MTLRSSATICRRKRPIRAPRGAFFFLAFFFSGLSPRSGIAVSRVSVTVVHQVLRAARAEPRFESYRSCAGPCCFVPSRAVERCCFSCFVPCFVPLPAAQGRQDLNL